MNIESTLFLEKQIFILYFTTTILRVKDWGLKRATLIFHVSTIPLPSTLATLPQDSASQVKLWKSTISQITSLWSNDLNILICISSVTITLTSSRPKCSWWNNTLRLIRTLCGLSIQLEMAIMPLQRTLNGVKCSSSAIDKIGTGFIKNSSKEGSCLSLVLNYGSYLHRSLEVWADLSHRERFRKISW